MKQRLGVLAAVATATVFVQGSVAVAQGRPAGEEGQRTLIFRSLEDDDISSEPQACPFTGANLFLGATLWSMQTRAGDSRVVNEAVRQIGTAAACGLITGPLVPATLVPFYVEFTMDR